jgi:hypothetical protein
MARVRNLHRIDLYCPGVRIKFPSLELGSLFVTAITVSAPCMALASCRQRE